MLHPDCSHRRKSSLVSVDDTRSRPHLDNTDERTACFVHSLIMGEWITSPSKSDLRPNVRQSKAHETSVDDDAITPSEAKDRKAFKANHTAVQSRHLTKKQLSDMAWNVRKLSKKLGSIKLKLTVKSVLLVTKVRDESLVALTRKVTQWLLSKDRSTKYVVYVEKRLETHPDFGAAQLIQEEPTAEGRLKYWDDNMASEEAHLFDFVVTLGGDGTVLYTSWLFQHVVPPVLSFSLGSLGFLTRFDFNQYQSILETAFKDGVVVSLRPRFECTIMRSNRRPEDDPSNITKRDLVEELIGEEKEGTLTHRPDKIFQILNDVVLDRGPNPSKSLLNALGLAWKMSP